MLEIRLIPVLSDNYSYLLLDSETKKAAIVDPAGEKEVLYEAIEKANVELIAILNTHHHWDHTGGNLDVLQQYPGIQVIGSAQDAEKIPGITHRVSHGETVKIGTLSVRVHYIPCHTRGHVAYECEGSLFCGDTLFIAGCGRFFEGDASQMYKALVEVIGALPEETKVYCGHEYTVSNLKFALHIEPENKSALEKIKWAEEQRKNGIPTVPSTLREEKLYNPFMRVNEASIQNAVQSTDSIEVMRLLRERKNNF